MHRSRSFGRSRVQITTVQLGAKARELGLVKKFPPFPSQISEVSGFWPPPSIESRLALQCSAITLSQGHEKGLLVTKPFGHSRNPVGYAPRPSTSRSGRRFRVHATGDSAWVDSTRAPAFISPGSPEPAGSCRSKDSHAAQRRRADAFQEKRLVLILPAARSAPRNTSLASPSWRASAMDSTEYGSKNNAPPGPATSRSTSNLEQATGTPKAWASITGMPKPSKSEGNTNRAAPRYKATRDSSVTTPSTLTKGGKVSIFRRKQASPTITKSSLAPVVSIRDRNASIKRCGFL